MPTLVSYPNYGYGYPQPIFPVYFYQFGMHWSEYIIIYLFFSLIFPKLTKIPWDREKYENLWRIMIFITVLKTELDKRM